MSEIEWKVPTQASYDAYVRIIGAFFQKKADMQNVMNNTIADGVGMGIISVTPTIRFLEAVHILEGDTKLGYKLTEIGTKYAKAMFEDNEKEIQETWKAIVENSYLMSLNDFIELNKNNLTLENLYKHIRGKGRFAVGGGISGMSAPYAAGSRTILQMFKKAKIIPEHIEIIAPAESKVSVKKTKVSSKKTSSANTSTDNSRVVPSDWVSYSVENFNMAMQKEVDVDTFDFIKSQIESTLDFWEKKFVKNLQIEDN